MSARRWSSRSWSVMGWILCASSLACDEQKIPPLKGVPPALAAAEEANRVFAPTTTTLLAASPGQMPKASRQITLADGSAVVALYDREGPSESDPELPPGTPLVFGVRPDGAVIPLACPASLIARSRETKTKPLLVPFGDGAAIIYRGAFPNDRPALFVADLTARTVVDTGQSADLLGPGAAPDRFVIRQNDSGQGRVVRWDGAALLDLFTTPIPSSASYLDEPASGVIAYLAPLVYRRSDAAEDIPLPNALFGGQPFDGAALVRREPTGELLLQTFGGISRWAVETDRSVVQLAALPAFADGLSASADTDFARTPATRFVENAYDANLLTPRGGVLRTFANGAFSVREVGASPCASAPRCDRVGETFLRDAVGEGANARALQVFYPWIEGGHPRLVVTAAALDATGAGGSSGSGGASGTAGAGGADVGGSGGGSGGSEAGGSGASGASGAVCPVACPAACDAFGLCAPLPVDAGPILGISASEVGNVAVLRPSAAAFVSKEAPSVVGPLFDGFAAAVPSSVLLSNADLYLATSTGVLWRDAFGTMSAALTPAGARVVGVTPTHVYTAAPFGGALAVQRNQRPHGAGEIVACLPQTGGPTIALDVRDVDGGVLVARGGEIYRYDGVAGGACETVPDGTRVIALPTGSIDNLVYDPASDRVHVSAGTIVTTTDSFGGFTLPLPPGRDTPTALAARQSSLFYVQASGAPGLPDGVAALVENTDGAVKTITVVPDKVTAIAATDKHVYWITEGGALLHVPR